MPSPSTLPQLFLSSEFKTEPVYVKKDVIRLRAGGNGGAGQQIQQGFNSKNSSEGKAVLRNMHTSIKRGRATTGLVASMTVVVSLPICSG